MGPAAAKLRRAVRHIGSWHFLWLGFCVFSLVTNARTSLDRLETLEGIASAKPSDAEDAADQLRRMDLYRGFARHHAWLAVFWVLFGLVIAVGLVRRTREFHRAERVAAGACSACGYDLRVNRDLCPECGARVPPGASRPGPERLT